MRVPTLFLIYSSRSRILESLDIDMIISRRSYNIVDVALNVCCVWEVLYCESNLSPHGEVSRHTAPGSGHLRGQYEVFSVQTGENLQQNLIR